MKRKICLLFALCMIFSCLNVCAVTIEIPDVLEYPTDHRPVPTEFEKSKDLSDLYYFPMAGDPDETFAKLEGGKKLMGNDALFYEGATMQGKEYGHIETVPVSGMPFDKALHITTTAIPSAHSGFNYRIYPDDFPGFGDYKDGDICLAKFYVRKISGGDIDSKTSRIYAYFCERSFSKTGDGKAYKVIEFSDDWQTGYVPVVLNHDYGEKGYIFSLNAIYFEGEVEVGGFELYSFGNKYTYDDMPQCNAVYKGCEEDARWRKDAMARIEQVRKGDVSITVKDENGNPIPNADVKVDMYEHEFNFGVAIGKQMAELEKYRKAVVENFNYLGTEGYYHRTTVNDDENPQYNYCDAFLKFAKRNGINNGTHGHALMWDAQLTKFWMEPYKDIYKDEAKLKQSLKDHIFYMAKRFPLVTTWDVSNEDGSRYEDGKGITMTFKGLYGKEFLIDIYKWAREAMPNATLCLGDGFTVASLNNYEKSEDSFLNWALRTLDFDVLVTHGHAGYATQPMDSIETLTRLAKFNKPIRITEFDTHGITDDINYQANIARDCLIAYFSVPEVETIQLWGFWNSSGKELQHRFVYYNDFTLKPGGKVYQDLVYNKWWTRESGKTDANGNYSLRAYYGDYDIKVTANGITRTLSIPLRKNSKNDVEITVDSKTQNMVAKLVKDDKKASYVSTCDGDKNDIMVIAEYDENSRLVNASCSKGVNVINRINFLSTDFERKSDNTIVKPIIFSTKTN